METPDHSAAWRDLRIRQTWFYGTFYGCLPFGMLAFWIKTTLGPDEFFSFAVIGYAISCFILGTWLMAFDCPNCGKRFFASTRELLGVERSYRNAFSKKCLHCGTVPRPG